MLFSFSFFFRLLSNIPSYHFSSKPMMLMKYMLWLKNDCLNGAYISNLDIF